MALTLAGTPAINGLALPTDTFVSGMVLVAPAVEFTAVSSVNINNCFSATYNNYRVVLNATLTSYTGISLRWRNAGTDDSSSNYFTQRTYTEGATVGGDRTSSASYVNIGYSDTTGGVYTLDVFNPKIATPTSFISLNAGRTPSSNIRSERFDTGHNVSSSFDGFTIYSTANMSGSIRVYGLRNT